jgi:phenylalanyl-tRNA synthetase beta chain
MKISLNWLKDYIDLNYNENELADILTGIGLEVEGIETFESVPGGLRGCVIGEIITCGKHPDADRLSLTTVDIGQGNYLPIVCGAPNVKKGQKVVVATIGTTLYKGEESLIIEKTKLRGAISEGMICAEDELGLGSSHEGIMVLPDNAKVGTPASEYFKITSDIIFEIGLTPNRIENASHFGVARDLAAYLSLHGKIELRKPDIGDFVQDNNDLLIDVVIENTNGCRRYSGISITGINVAESPSWLKTKLMAIGLNPINNVVDITNFVLHELNQPLHAFDADRVKGNKVIVKTLKEGTPFVTLDGVERKLSGKDLMICNIEEGMCIAGVFGGAESGVTESTKNIFLESACFSPTFIRKTVRRHGLNTDAAFRFERGTDPAMTVYALKRAAMLIRAITGGKISSPVIDVCPLPVEPIKVTVSYKNINRLVGNILDRKIVRKLLNSLEIKILKEEDDKLILSVPTYRVDVTGEADIVEEILRMYGYNNVIIDGNVTSVLSNIIKPDILKLTNSISDYLTANGFSEIMNNSLSKEIYYKDDKTAIQLFNPLSTDLNRLRNTLFYGGMESISFNLNRQRPNLRFYEFGNCYFLKEKSDNKDVLDKYKEEQHLSIFMTGNRSDGNWIEKNKSSSFYELKSHVETILLKAGIRNYDLASPESASDFIYGGIALIKEKKEVAVAGIVNEKWLKFFDLKNQVFYADLNWAILTGMLSTKPVTFIELPRFPEVRRDISMMLKKTITYEEIRQLAFQTEKKILKRIILFDVYEGEKIEKDKKSYAVSFILQDENRTLTDDIIEKTVNNLASVFEKRLGAQIRRG